MLRHRPLLTETLTAIGLIAAPFVLPYLGFAPNTVNQILIWGLFGIGFDILYGFTGLLSFGQSAFYGTGGFVAAYLLVVTGLPDVVLGLIIGMVAAAAVGYVVGLIALRRTGIYFAMITVAIAETFFFLENKPLSEWTGGENGIPGVPTPSFNLFGLHYQVGPGWSMYGFLAVCYFIGIVIALCIVRSPVGAVLSAIRDNPLRAAAVGHNVHGYKLAAFVIAAAYAGFAGGLLGVLQAFMPPEAFHLRHLRPIGHPDGDRRRRRAVRARCSAPRFGSRCAISLQGALGLGATWKLVFGVVFVLLVCFLQRGLIGGIGDVYALATRRGATKIDATDTAPAPSSDRGGGAEDGIGGDADNGARQRRSDKQKKYAGPILQASGLTKRYGGLLANSDIDFAVNRGELRGIIGPNGAGKTTFCKMLTCEVPPRPPERSTSRAATSPA